MNNPNPPQTARAQRAAHLKQQLKQHREQQLREQQQREQQQMLQQGSQAPAAAEPNAPAPSQALHPTTNNLAPAHLAQQVLRTLIDDKSDLQAMVKLLREERTVLEQREHGALEQYAEQKIALAAKLETRHKARESLLPHSGATAANNQSWRASIETLEKKSSVTLLPSWEEVETLLRESQELLQINEKIVGSMQNNVSRFMSALRGETGSGQTYTAAGKAQTYSDKQPIISA